MSNETSKAITRLLSHGMELRLSRDFNYCKIVLLDQDKEFSQMLPLDSHIYYALGGCIDFCINKLLSG